jgi:DNA sulfur modification protein DndD
MLIESISIVNFRQFYGEVSLKFSTHREKNITVVHGSNGSGKTSLLNAFKWCFYGKTDFDTQEDNILNKAAIENKKDGGLVDIKIEVKFLHDNKRYCAIRSQKFKKIKGVIADKTEESYFALDVTGDDGQTKRSSKPHAELKSILPPDLQPYFFFNGERIEHIAGVNQSVHVQDAIRKLMGIDMVERAITHVNKAKNIYRKAVRSEVSDDERYLHDLIESSEEKIRHYNEVLVKSQREKEISKSKIGVIERELKTFDNSRNLQEKRDDFERQVELNNDQAIKIKDRQKILINESSFLVLSENLFKKCESLVEDNRKKGVLPYGIKEQFIDDIIIIGKCICGANIVQGSDEHRCLLDVRKTAGSNALESAYSSVSALLKSHDDDVCSFKFEYKNTAKNLKEITSSNARIKQKIEDISAQLVKVDDEFVANLEIKRKKEVEVHLIAVSDEGIANHEIFHEENLLKGSKGTLERIEEQESQRLIANLRMSKAEEISNVLINLREALANQVRTDLSDKVNMTFKSIIRKPVEAIIDLDYRLQVLKKTAEGEEYVVHEQSTGERQVTSLSFIASIIALAKQKHEGGKSQFFQGGLYPLVMDSPFGSLDDDYREKVARGVSQLAEQVIIFVSNSQWNGRVKTACQDRVGKSYQLLYHSPKDIRGMDPIYTRKSENGFEYSTLNEVKL